MNVRIKFLILPILLAATLTAKAQGTSEGVTNYNATFGGTVPGTAGWTFRTTDIITVTSLGAFDGVLGTQSPLSIGLWNDSGVLLASNSVSISSPIATALAHYSSITPVVLAPGETYHIGAYSPSIGTLLVGIALPSEGGFVYLSPEVILRGSASSLGGFGSPAEDNGANGAIYAAPNFQYLAVPEPSSFVLLGMGGIGLWLGVRRKNSRR